MDRSLAGHGPWGRRTGHDLRAETTTTMMLKTGRVCFLCSKGMFFLTRPRLSYGSAVSHPHPGSFETVSHFIGISNCTFQLVIIFSFAVYLFMSSWGKKDLKKCYMLMIYFLTAILSAPFCTYMIMKQFA